MTDLRTHIYSKFHLPSGVSNSCWNQSILQLRFLTARVNKRHVKVDIEKEGLRFSRSWKEVSHGRILKENWTYATTSGHWSNGCAPVGKRTIEDTFTGEGNKIAARPDGPCGDRIHHRSKTIGGVVEK